jgi:hypothetical protein
MYMKIGERINSFAIRRREQKKVLYYQQFPEEAVAACAERFTLHSDG